MLILILLIPLLFITSSAQSELQNNNRIYFKGAIIREDTTQKNIYLFFTGHEFAEGSSVILNTLNKHDIKASFFFTGDFYRNPNFKDIIYRLKSDNHYLGAHSDKHLLYASWEKRDSTLISFDQYKKDVLNNYLEMNKFGIKDEDVPYYLPPYEWYNDTISIWTEKLGFTLINFTPGTSANQDWSIPELGKGYYSSDTIYNRILRYEETSSNGLNGFLLLTHIGTDPRRTDKFYIRLDSLISELKKRGYKFSRLNSNSSSPEEK